MLKKTIIAMALLFPAFTFTGCDDTGCDMKPDLLGYNLINRSGQKIAVALHDVQKVFPDSVILYDGENYKWRARSPFQPFLLSNRFNIYFNDTLYIHGKSFPKGRDISEYEAYEVVDYILTFTFTESDYLYALKHGSIVRP